MTRTYADLAELYDRQGQPKHRDWFLVLAADAALSAGQPAEADRLLGRLLGANPHHFLKPFASFAEALRSPDVQGYVANLKRNYPPARAQQLLETERQKAGGAGHEEPPPRAPQRPVAPGPAQPPRAEPEVIFARIRPEPRTAAEPEPEPPPSPPRPSPLPRTPAPMPKPRPLPRPAEAEAPPAPAPPPETRPPHGALARPRETPPEVSPVIPVGLFVLLLLLGLGLGAYALLRPFLPPEWLP
jgi:hypothetical protein